MPKKSPCILNILLFIPLGIFVPLLWDKHKRLWHTLATSLAFSLLIELSQLWNNRSTDVDDLLMNTLGGCLGFVLYRAIASRMTRRRPGTAPDTGAHSGDPSDGGASGVSGGISGGELALLLVVLFAGRFFCFNEMGMAKRLYGF